ncbi:bifunctional peptidase and arginyl-hydroxylase JMJD5-like [Argopecten irradians]|uniref:bifunctional peptidase and arginyl-hydroxylase JMJD5-like n=1 Tax=Argopecten irradians TaxID=31199 RepID=UPI0037177D2E
MTSNLLQKLLAEVPESKTTLICCVATPNEMAPSVASLMGGAVDKFLGSEYELCVKLCDPLLDLTWEKLNTGHWKDVSLCWRHTYSLISLLKGVSQVATATIGMDSIESDVCKENLANSIKTLDMGLLMGAPIFENVLTKVSLYVHDWLGANSMSKASTSRKQPFKTNLNLVKESQCYCPENNESGNHKLCETDPKRQKLENIDVEMNTKKEIQRICCPSMELFRREYLSAKRPVIITDSMGHWPSMSNRRWSPSYLRKIAGYRTVPIELGSKYTDDKWTQKLMTVNEFIDQCITKENVKDEPIGYLAQHQLFNQVPELQDDIIIPDYCVLGLTESERSSSCDEDAEDVDINAWFGPKGTVSPLHHDPKENFLAQVVGRKYIRLYSESMTPFLYPHDGFMDNTSQVDVEHPDYTMFPRFRNATCCECILEEGEMLFIPMKCWHFVKSLSVSFSVSFWWK